MSSTTYKTPGKTSSHSRGVSDSGRRIVRSALETLIDAPSPELNTAVSGRKSGFSVSFANGAPGKSNSDGRKPLPVLEEPSALLFLSPAKGVNTQEKRAPLLDSRGRVGGESPEISRSLLEDVELAEHEQRRTPDGLLFTLEEVEEKVREALDAYERERDDEETALLEEVGKEVDEQNRRYDALIEVNQKLGLEKQELQNALQSAQADGQAMKETLSKLRVELHDQKIKNDQLNVELVHTRDVYRETTEGERVNRDEVGEMKRKLEELASQLRMKEDDKAALQEKYTTSERQLTQLRDALKQYELDEEEISRRMAALGTCMTNMENTLLQKDEEIEKLKKKLSLSEKKTARESQASEQVAHLQEQVQQQTDEVRRKMHRILLLEQENDVLKEELSRRDGFVASTTSNQQFIVNLLESLKRTAMDLKQTSCPSKAHKDDDGEGERVSPAPRRTVRPRSLSRLSKSVGATVKSAGTARRSSSRRTRNQEQDDSLLSVSHLNSSMVAIIKEIESALEATKRTISTKSETHAIHLREQQQIGELVEKYKTLAETLSEREKELSDLQTECNLRGQDLDALEKYVSAQNHKMSASLKLVEEWKEKATSLGDELAAVKSTVIEHESYVDKLKADLEEAQKKHADMNKDLETKCAAVLEAEGRVDALRKQLDNETKKGEELLAVKEKEYLRLQEEKKTLEEECGRLQKLVDSFTEQQNTLDNRFDLERKELTSHLHSLRDSCDLLQRKLQSCSKCMKDSMFELSLAQSGEVETLNSLLDILGTPHSAIVQNAPSYRAGAAVSPSDSPEKFMNSCRRDTQFIAELRRSVISRARQIVHNGGAAASSPSRTPVRESPLQGAPPTSMSNTREEYFDDYFGGRTPTVKSLFLAEREPSPSPRLLPYSSSKANRKRLSLTNASPTSAYGLSQSKSRQEGAVDGSVSPARPPVLSEAFRL